MSNLVGTILLNRFRVDAYLGAGGMSVVYRVWDMQRNAPLAMKVLHADLSEDPNSFKRVQREAQALMELAHPHIVTFYGMFQADGITFLLEQYVDGPTLEAILRQRGNQPLSPFESLIYLQALCSALGYAHNRGFVHCDLKPGNVMVDRGGNIYLTDFGIARHAHSSTTTLGVVGTPAYMAPEQFMNKPVSAPTDIYALGALLYKLLTGRRPYTDMPTGAEASVTPPEGAAYAHLFQPPPNPLEANPGLPPALANVVLTAMAKDPARRYQTTMQLLEAACAAIGVVPNQLPARISLTDLETGTLRVQPMPSGPAGTMRASPAYQATSPAAAPYPQTMPQERIYPETAAVPAAGKGRAGIPPWIWALAGLFIVALLCGGALIFAGLPVLDRLLDTPTSAPTLAPTATSLPPGVPTLPPSQTPLPTFTPLATYTALPTHTPPPPPTEAPPPTQPPPTARPDVSNPLVRIRNRTGYDANLYRIGRTGESHFLGWLVTGFYGEYKFPSLGEWVIRYCHRDPNGDSFNCREKQINVTAEGQEFSVP